MEIYIIIGVLLTLIVYFFIVYNKLIKLKNLVNEAFGTMDVYLKKRWDLIPSIIETVKGYAKHETDTFNSIVMLRNEIYEKMNNNEKVEINSGLREKINKLMVIAEDYPELKASNNFIDLSTNLSKVEEDIADSRRYYNATVRLANNKIEMFPSNIVAKILGYKTFKMFEASIDEKKNINIEL